MRSDPTVRPIVPEIVAHRGYASRYPENTLLALRAALDAGAGFIEVDVLLSADGVPVLMHDATLSRTAGRNDHVATLSWSELRRIEVAERPRLGDAGAGETVPSLAQLVELLSSRPAASAFIEIKRDALAQAGLECVVSRVLDDLMPIRERAIVISFSAEAVAHARAQGAQRIGWVLERYDDTAHATARDLAPEFLFCNHEKLPPAPAPLWAGPWSWVAYEVRDTALARALAARGVKFIETMAVGEMVAALGARVR